MHASASSARTVQVITSFLFFHLPPSESYYTKVRNVIYGDYERAWPFSCKTGHRKFRSNYKRLEKHPGMLRVGQDLRGTLQSCPSPLQSVSLEYFHTLFPLTYRTITQHLLSIARAWDWVRQPGSRPRHHTVFPTWWYQHRYAPSTAPATRYNISIGLHKTNLLSLTFSFGVWGQGFQQLGLKFSIFQFFISLTGLPVRANDCWK